MQDARKIPLPSHRYSIPMYLVAGGIATASHYVTTIAAVEGFAVVPLAASIMGFCVGSLLATLFAGNAAFFALFHDVAGLHYMLAQVLTTCALIPPGYLMSRTWVFRTS